MTVSNWIEIKALEPGEVKKVVDEIEASLARKKKEGLFTEREIREIEEMKLRPLADIQDVQSVHEDIMYRKDA